MERSNADMCIVRIRAKFLSVAIDTIQYVSNGNVMLREMQEEFGLSEAETRTLMREVEVEYCDELLERRRKFLCTIRTDKLNAQISRIKQELIDAGIDPNDVLKS